MKLADSNGGDNYIIPVSSGALKAPHVKNLGPAFPLLVKFEDMVTSGCGTDGLVHGGTPVADATIAELMGVPRKTIAEWRRRLVRAGYITSKATPAGNILRVRKSKKLLWLLGSKKAVVGAPESQPVVLPNLSQDAPKSSQVLRKNGGGAPEKGRINKTVAGQKQDVEQAAATEGPWKAIGSDLAMGSLAFQRIWVFYFGSKNGTPLSEAMERCIQRAQAKQIKVPRPFYQAKRQVEESEQAGPAEPRWDEGIVRLDANEVPA